MRTESIVSRLRRRLGRLAAPANRRILLEMVRANIKASDYHTFLGGLWSLLGTAVMLLLFYFIFRRHFGAGVRGYPLYLLTGIIVVNFFITATSNLLRVLILNRDIALNSTIPRENFVLSAISINARKLGIELAVAAGLSLAYGFFGWRSAVFLVPVVLSFLALVLGTGLTLALVFCFARDIEHLWGIFSRLFLFATPVFYTADSLSPRMGFLVRYLNPLTPFLDACRSIFLQRGALAAPLLLHVVLLGGLALSASYLLFLRLEGAALDRT